MKRDYEGAPVRACAFCRGYLLEPGVLERLIARREEVFGEEERAKVRAWRERQTGSPWASCDFADATCPECGGRMTKQFHSLVTRVVVDRCVEDRCGCLWFDTGELEAVQMLIEESADQADRLRSKA